MSEPQPALDLTAVAREVRQAVREELDEILPHLLAALKRDRAFDELSERLKDAERRLEARRERPVVIGTLRVLHLLRHLEFDPEAKAAMDAELVDVLAKAGYQEIGAVGEPFDPTRHEALAGEARNGQGVVVELYATGLDSFGHVVVPARVRVGLEAPSPEEDE